MGPSRKGSVAQGQAGCGSCSSRRAGFIIVKLLPGGCADRPPSAWRVLNKKRLTCGEGHWNRAAGVRCHPPRGLPCCKVGVGLVSKVWEPVVRKAEKSVWVLS